MRHARPPWVPTWLLSVTLPRSLRETVLGDLAESYGVRAAIEGTAAARRWYWRESWRAFRALASLTDEPTHLTSPRGPMDGFFADTRFAWRLFTRRPLVTLIALLTLGLGIGMTTAIFSVVKPALLEGIPYPGGDRLVMIWEREPDGSASNVGYPTILDFRSGARAIETAAAVSYWQPTLLGRGEPLRIRGQRVSHQFFATLGMTPALGRDFLPADDQPGTAPVAIISHRLWRDRFAADPSVIGKPISLSGNPTTIVGILPDRFESLIDPTAEIWSPLRYDLTVPSACRTCRHLRMVGRLTAGATPASAQAEIATISSRLIATYPTEYPAGGGVLVEPLKLTITKAAKPALLALFGAVGLVQVLACVNVANLLIGQAVQRDHEFSVRMALGSGRPRLVRQLLIESASLGLAGAALGLVVSTAALRLLPLATDLPRRQAIAVDGVSWPSPHWWGSSPAWRSGSDRRWLDSRAPAHGSGTAGASPAGIGSAEG